MDETPVLLERQGAVAIMTLNRPEKHNAISQAMSAALGQTIEALDADKSVHVIVITGAGSRAFCAGADMAEALERQAQAEAQPRQPQTGTPLTGVAMVARAKKPVIAAVNGFAYGLGAQLALSADFRIASTTAKFRFVSTSYGLVVSGADLPRVVGAAMAKELLFSTRVVEGEEAARIGLANRVVGPDALLPTTLELAQQIAANSPEAVQWAKRVVDAATVLDAGYEAERDSNLALRGSSDQSARFRDAAERVIGAAPER
jgi:enoyl-CoA hydratase/carnithine racemase